MLPKAPQQFRKRKAAGHWHLPVHCQGTGTLMLNLVWARPKEGLDRKTAWKLFQSQTFMQVFKRQIKDNSRFHRAKWFWVYKEKRDFPSYHQKKILGHLKSGGTWYWIWDNGELIDILGASHFPPPLPPWPYFSSSPVGKAANVHRGYTILNWQKAANLTDGKSDLPKTLDKNLRRYILLFQGAGFSWISH